MSLSRVLALTTMVTAGPAFALAHPAKAHLVAHAKTAKKHAPLARKDHRASARVVAEESAKDKDKTPAQGESSQAARPQVASAEVTAPAEGASSEEVAPPSGSRRVITHSVQTADATAP